MALTTKVTINGTEYTLTDMGDGTYKATLTASQASSFNNNDGHYYPVNVELTDIAGNTAEYDDTHAEFGNSLKLYVQEKNKPIITNVSPAAGANVTTSNPTFKFRILDNSSQTSGYSGINTSSLVFKLNGTAVSVDKLTISKIDGGYDVTYTPGAAVPDGECTFSIDVSDYDGNSADTVSATFKIDTVPPSLNVTGLEEGKWYREEKLTIAIDTSDATSSPVTVTVGVNGKDQGTVSVGANGHADKEITFDEGENTVIITATDSAGKVSTMTFTAYLKTTKPRLLSVQLNPNPVSAGQLYEIIVTAVDE